MGRFLWWLYDKLDLLSYSEFFDYDEKMVKFCETLTRNIEAQLSFNKLVAERLGLKRALSSKKALKNPAAKTEDVAFG